MKHRAQHDPRRRDDLNRGDYRDDFGPEGRHRFAGPPERDDVSEERRYHPRHERHDRESLHPGDERKHDRPAGPWRWRRTAGEGWQRGRISGGYGSQYDAWRSGAGFAPAGFGFGPDEDPGRGGFEDRDWQPTRPARGRGAWAGDWENEGYRGRGPRDYKRSDERVREEVCERLTDDWSVDASDITVQVRDGEVTLQGSVPSREQKRRASECVEEVSGVRDVFNSLRIATDAGEREHWRPNTR